MLLAKFRYDIHPGKHGYHIVVRRLLDGKMKHFFQAGETSLNGFQSVNSFMNSITDDQAVDYFPKGNKSTTEGLSQKSSNGSHRTYMADGLAFGNDYIISHELHYFNHLEDEANMNMKIFIDELARKAQTDYNPHTVIQDNFNER